MTTATNTNASTAYFSDFYQGVPHLVKSIGYQFSSVELLKRALTHRSYDSKHSYERLEFLGDSLLGMVIAKALFHQYPDYDEGRLTRMRATLVRQETLVEIAQDLQLFNHVILGMGEKKGGGRHRASILADCVEAIIGAIYLDCQDMTVLQKIILSWYKDKINTVGKEKVLKDAKSRLQEWLQAKKLPLPTYTLLETIGTAPVQTFVIQCSVAIENCPQITEMGESRRIAEQKCAERMINQLNTLMFENPIKYKPA